MLLMLNLVYNSVASSPGSLDGNRICVGGKLHGQWPRTQSLPFLLSQLSSDFTGTRILFVILCVVDVVRMAEQERNCILSRLAGSCSGVLTLGSLRMGAHKS